MNLINMGVRWQSANYYKKSITIKIDTRKAGTSDSFSFTIPRDEVMYNTYNANVEWGDGSNEYLTNGDVWSHTYATEGVYNITIKGTFPKFYFNNRGDRLKLIEILNLGGAGEAPNQRGAFYGCENLTFLQQGADLEFVVEAPYMFAACKFTKLPQSVRLNNLEIGDGMFLNNNISELPTNMTLTSLASGNEMFQGNNIGAMPELMVLPNLVSGGSMFQFNKITALPNTMTLGNLIVGNRMFRGNLLTSLPESIHLKKLESGINMFLGNSISNISNDMTLEKLSVGQNFFAGSKINTIQYSNLLIKIESLNINDNVEFGGGTSKYNSSGKIARDLLTARGWVITDGGLEI